MCHASTAAFLLDKGALAFAASLRLCFGETKTNWILIEWGYRLGKRVENLDEFDHDLMSRCHYLKTISVRIGGNHPVSVVNHLILFPDSG